MISQTPRKRGRKRDLYTRIAKGKSHRPQKISAAKISWSCTEEQHGQRVPLRFFEYGQEIGAAHEYQGSSVVQHDEEVDGVDLRFAQVIVRVRGQGEHRGGLVVDHSIRSGPDVVPGRPEAAVDEGLLVPAPVSLFQLKRSPMMPRRKSVSCAVMLAAVAVASPCTNKVLGI